MIHLHCTKKLLNTSRLEGPLLITEKDVSQLMHDWYVTLSGSGFAGKFFVVYCHQPSLLTILVPGKSIKKSFDEFKIRLLNLLTRFEFPKYFINLEMKLTEEFVVGKTNSRSMLAYLNEINYHNEWRFKKFSSYDTIDLIEVENMIMSMLYSVKGEKDYKTPTEYWENELNIILKKLLH